MGPLVGVWNTMEAVLSTLKCFPFSLWHVDESLPSVLLTLCCNYSSRLDTLYIACPCSVLCLKSMPTVRGELYFSIVARLFPPTHPPPQGESKRKSGPCLYCQLLPPPRGGGELHPILVSWAQRTFATFLELCQRYSVNQGHLSNAAS